MRDIVTLIGICKMMMIGKSLKISDYLSSLEKKNPVGDISAGNETIRSFFFLVNV